jgi:hypothetical protein
LLGKIRGDPTDNKAIAILSKTEFQTSQVKELGRKLKVVSSEEYFHNSIFRKYWLRLGQATD